MTVYRYYRRCGRDLPWRHTTDPYRILISEIMLQQTQIPRVIEKYTSFTRRFRTIRSLARAPLAACLAEWQGLGYNRRAVFLHELAAVVVNDHAGRLPRTIDALESLPGIGHYTARAVAAFAYNIPSVFIETNIRSVFIHHFYPKRTSVRDEEILPIIEAALDRKNARRWYSALMDYGTWLKKEHGNPSRQSAHHTRQSAFVGSDRQIRGAIVRTVLTEGRIGKDVLSGICSDQQRLERIIASLANDGIILVSGESIRVRG